MNTAERINEIASKISLQSYLEIGVQEGITFNKIHKIPYKVAVDPVFRLEYKKYESENVKFFETTSDIFFQTNEIKFDIIFLDGLHEFKQTLRDFINALEFSHEKTIIIIDDVYPNDIYSSLVGKNLDSDYCYSLRSHFHPESRDGRWHGDVYKVIAFIHDFYPNITMQTISDNYGNPQTICYKKYRSNHKPQFNSLEAIERLTYFDLIEDTRFYCVTTEEDALANAIKYLKSF
ncbi:class I SAM-dependent methyltransferase [Polynucleobacter paneuropaeus]|jgi:hypothetical protein|uniref:Class I SAM-dependent methyltransferase n=1 Tax=Polynucleobacter paneuropaeus TaxID=2527775 RepID=A0A2Z4JUD3_9BURK|nr:class I SAM-dependent methyltransferase [Polynucleobacter paneuropaeus]AWW50330.1 class I SAM-dependent methyltransferase [Polynucleobacter paneuropaeus]QWD45569.1 class I SAM-dependent methyltransferase [Polynucleobacter paneuropaeus]